jgi:hypothetical protein
MDPIGMNDVEILVRRLGIVAYLEASMSQLDPKPHFLQGYAFEKAPVPFLTPDFRN